MPPDRCPDCGAPATGPYCAACGQRVDVDPKSLVQWVRDALGELLSVDGRLLRTLRAILFRPGFLTLEWREGRRARWTSPFRLYLLSSLTFFTTSLLVPTGGTFQVGGAPVPDPALQNAITAAQTEALGTVAPQVLIAVVPLLAIILRVLFGGRLYFVEHLVHAVHLQSFLLLLLLLFFTGILLPGAVVPFLGLGLIGVFFAYLLLSCRRVYGRGPVRTVVGVSLAFLAYVAVTFAALGAVVAFVAEDPTEALRLADEEYRELRGRWAAGDSSAGASAALAVAVAYRRLESHLLDPPAMGRAAEMLVAADSAEHALALSEQALVRAPDDLLLLGVAMTAAAEVGADERARRYAERVLSVEPPPDEDERRRSDAAAVVARARALLEEG